MANDNLARLKDAYARWHESRGKDEKVWGDLMADDVRVLSLAAGVPGMEFTREVRSRADLEGYFRGLRQDWEMIHYTVDEYLVDGDRIAAMGTTSWRHRKTRREFETPKADFAFFKDGRIVEWYEFYDTAAILAAAQGTSSSGASRKSAAPSAKKRTRASRLTRSRAAARKPGTRARGGKRTRGR